MVFISDHSGPVHLVLSVVMVFIALMVLQRVFAIDGGGSGKFCGRMIRCSICFG